jgi:hypothetical protein
VPQCGHADQCAASETKQLGQAHAAMRASRTLRQGWTFESSATYAAASFLLAFESFSSAFALPLVEGSAA